MKILEPNHETPSEKASESNTAFHSDALRRRFLRANTAVALIVIAVLGLAIVAILAGIQSKQDQQIAEQAQAEAKHDLWRAYLADLRATRQSATLSRRSDAIETARKASLIHVSADLRNETIAALALDDFSLESTHPAPPDSTARSFDRSLNQWAAGLPNGEVLVLDLKLGKPKARLTRERAGLTEAQSNVQGIEFSPDGTLLGLRFAGGGIVVWNIASDRIVFQHDTDEGRGAASRPRFSSDGKHLVASVHTPRTGIAVFELSTGSMIRHFPEFPLNAHAMPRPGTTMFAVNDYTNVVVMDWQAGSRVAQFGFPAGIRRMNWSPDGNLLAAGGNHLSVYLWSMHTQERQVLSGHRAEVWEVTFDPSGRRLATSSFDGTSRIWDTQSGRLLGFTDAGYILQFGHGGRVGFERPRQSMEVRRLAPSGVYRPLYGLDNWYDATRILDLSPDGKWAASAIRNEQHSVSGVAWWDLQEGGEARLAPFEGIHSVSFDPTQWRLWLTHDRGLSFVDTATSNPKGESESLSLRSQIIPLPQGFRPFVIGMAADGSSLAVEDPKQGGLVLNAASPKVQSPMPGVTHNTVHRFVGASPSGGGSLALSPHGRWLASGFNGRAGVSIWDVHSQTQVAVLDPGAEGLVQFSPDGQSLAVGGEKNYRLFRTSDWKEAWNQPRTSVSRYAGFLAFSPDGKILATVKMTDRIALLDTSTGRELTVLEAPDASAIVCLRWTTDGRRLVAGTRENRLDIWDIPQLRASLASLNMDWTTQPELPFTIPDIRPLRQAPMAPLPVLAVVGLGVVLLVALLATLALRQHRRLIEDYSRAESRAAEQARQLAVERDLAHLRNGFVSLVSHEFRTPLGVIVSSTDILRRYFDRLDPAMRQQQLDVIQRSTTALSTLIEDLLLLGKTEAGKLVFQPAPMDLPHLCRNLMDEVASATRGVCLIHFTVVGDVGDVVADEALLRPALINLLTNAVKYSKEGGTVNFTLRRESHSIVLDIQDRGIGIPQDDQGKLFSAFARGSNVGARAGTGLGLAIAKRCIEMHHGTISFTSTVGEGSTFTLQFPAATTTKPGTPTISTPTS